MPVLSPYFGAGVFDRIWSLITLVGAGMVVFFGSAYLVGAIDPDLLAMLRRRRPKRDERDDEILEVQ
jgi:putative peptidoglycan lipid II flippase